MFSPVAKFWVALVGSITTTLLGLIPPSTTFWIVLTCLSAAATFYGVWRVPNAPSGGDLP